MESDERSADSGLSGGRRIQGSADSRGRSTGGVEGVDGTTGQAVVMESRSDCGAVRRETVDQMMVTGTRGRHAGDCAMKAEGIEPLTCTPHVAVTV